MTMVVLMVMIVMMQSCEKLNLLRGENTEISFTPIEIGLFCFCPNLVYGKVD